MSWLPKSLTQNQIGWAPGSGRLLRPPGPLLVGPHLLIVHVSHSSFSPLGPPGPLLVISTFWIWETWLDGRAILGHALTCPWTFDDVRLVIHVKIASMLYVPTNCVCHCGRCNLAPYAILLDLTVCLTCLCLFLCLISTTDFKNKHTTIEHWYWAIKGE